MDETLLSAGEVMRMLELSPWQLRQKIDRGELPAFRTGTAKNSHLRFRREDVEAWLERQRVPVLGG